MNPFDAQVLVCFSRFCFWFWFLFYLRAHTHTHFKYFSSVTMPVTFQSLKEVSYFKLLTKSIRSMHHAIITSFASIVTCYDGCDTGMIISSLKPLNISLLFFFFSCGRYSHYEIHWMHTNKIYSSFWVCNCILCWVSSLNKPQIRSDSKTLKSIDIWAIHTFEVDHFNIQQ